ncbi:Protein of unknown function [Quadrisphaera granulorum]|uniref:Uncharacterized protein DUF3533 n=1 Tax=Quadrisphaera granulorum TaxID=317664 RepID=A0A315ZP10_9ACTN|nr:ABC transporter permease [Quadrisphaera granulorum]PWJ47216.1 uncharacterized protein DUF3533 [Quadrisphaera granulorum]SZE98902.1 Protein of unknown function [Quadrisphaera granulorum]
MSHPYQHAHRAEPAHPTLRAELRDAIAPRTVALVVAVLLLQMGFVLSYVGAFHHPKPREVAVTVVGPTQQVADQTAAALNGINGRPLDVTASTDVDAARADLTNDDTSAVLVIDPTSKQDQLLVTSAGGAATATAVQAVLTQAEATQGRTLAVQDVLPAGAGDARGLSGFYLVTGWVVGGYLLAALLGVARGARPANLRRAVIRLGAVLPYAVASGIGGALIVGPLLGALPHDAGTFWGLAGTGMLVVMASAAVTMAFQVLAGTIGIGLAVLLFVVLGNPSAGGAYPPPLLPPFWAWLSEVLPNGAAVDAVRRIAYFDGASVGQRLLVVVAWAVVGAAVTLVAARWHQLRARPTTS